MYYIVFIFMFSHLRHWSAPLENLVVPQDLEKFRNENKEELVEADSCESMSYNIKSTKKKGKSTTTCVCGLSAIR